MWRGVVCAVVLALAGCDDPPAAPSDGGDAGMTDLGPSDLAVTDLPEHEDMPVFFQSDLGDLGKMPVTFMDVGVICTSCTDGG